MESSLSFRIGACDIDGPTCVCLSCEFDRIDAARLCIFKAVGNDGRREPLEDPSLRAVSDFCFCRGGSPLEVRSYPCFLFFDPSRLRSLILAEDATLSSVDTDLSSCGVFCLRDGDDGTDLVLFTSSGMLVAVPTRIALALPSGCVVDDFSALSRTAASLLTRPSKSLFLLLPRSRFASSSFSLCLFFSGVRPRISVSASDA